MKIIYDVLDKYKGTLRVLSDQQRMTVRFEIDLPYKREVKPAENISTSS